MVIKKNWSWQLFRIHVQNKQWVSNPDFLKETVYKQIVTGSTGKAKYQAVKTFFHKKKKMNHETVCVQY